MTDNIVEVSDVNFESEVLKSDKPVIVDFWAEWCGPCRMVTPVIEEIANEHSEKVKVAKLNVDDNRETAAKYRIMSIPTVTLFKNGEIETQVVGARSKTDYEQSFGLK